MSDHPTQLLEEPSGSWPSRSSHGPSLRSLVATLAAMGLAWRIAEMIHGDKSIPWGWRLGGMIGMAIAALIDRPSLAKLATGALDKVPIGRK